MKNEYLKKLYLAIIAIQFLLTIFYFGIIFKLADTGVIGVPMFLIFSISSLCLYIGALRYFLNKKNKGKLLFIAFSGLSVSVPFLAWPYPPAFVAALGALLGVIGWRLNDKQNIATSLLNISNG